MRTIPLTKEQKRKNKIKRMIKQICIYLSGLILTILLGYMCVKYFGMKTVIIDQAMKPTLLREESVRINQLSYKFTDPDRMDVIVFRLGSSKNSPSYVRRIIGLPEETVMIKNGQLYINNEKIDITFNSERISDAGVAEEGITLGEDEYFVICDDYNDNHDDSRLDSIGTISKEQIIGKVWIRTTPLSKWGLIH